MWQGTVLVFSNLHYFIYLGSTGEGICVAGDSAGVFKSTLF